jgi:hypothetical protein
MVLCFAEPGQEKVEEEELTTATSASNGGSIWLWHHQSGQLGAENLHLLAGHSMVSRIPEEFE